MDINSVTMGEWDEICLLCGKESPDELKPSTVKFQLALTYIFARRNDPDFLYETLRLMSTNEFTAFVETLKSDELEKK
jgi:hypothetical protein